MAHYIFIVNVRTDDKHLDAPDATQIANELQSSLTFDSAWVSGIDRVSVRQVHTTFDTALAETEVDAGPSVLDRFRPKGEASNV